MSLLRGRAAILPTLLAAGLVAPAGAAGAQEVRYTRPVPVDAPGWVRVPLGPEVLRRAGAGEGLRLFGPEGEDVPFRREPAETPPETAAEAAEAAPRSFRLSFEPPDCRARSEEEAAVPSRIVCRVPAGSSGRFLRRLCFTASARGRAGVRLFSAEEGRWEEVGDGTWAPSPGEEPSRCVALDLTLTDPAAALRLELYGGGEEAPAVSAVTVEFRGEDLLFRARREGRHTLAYGPGVARSARAQGRPAPSAPPGVRPATVAPGPEEAAEVPPGAALPTSAGAAPTVAFDETWRVSAEDPEPGELHRLALPPEVYPVAAPGLEDLRLLVSRVPSQLQVPYLRWRPEEPVPAAELRGAAPVRSGEGAARIEIEPEAAGLPLSALVVSAAAAAFGPDRPARRVRVLAAGAGEADGEPGRAVSPWLAWDCRPRPPLPCRLTVALDGAATRGAERLVVEIDGGGAAETAGAGLLPAVDVELWRQRDVLLFAWPGDPSRTGGDGEAPRLAAGAPGLEAPDYELEDRRDELLARPWREARLVPEGSPEGRGRLGTWTLTLALLAAAVALLALLHRILSAQVRA